MKRWYNGPQSETMDMIYDHMEAHLKVSDLQDWAIISLHLARVVKQIEATHKQETNRLQTELTTTTCNSLLF